NPHPLSLPTRGREAKGPIGWRQGRQATATLKPATGREAGHYSLAKGDACQPDAMARGTGWVFPVSPPGQRNGSRASIPSAHPSVFLFRTEADMPQGDKG